MQIVQALLCPMNTFFYAAHIAYTQRLIKLCIDIFEQRQWQQRQRQRQRQRELLTSTSTRLHCELFN